MKFSELAKYFEEIENTSSRLTITQLLAGLFKKLSASEIDKTIYLLQGRVAPSFDALEFGFAERMIARAAGKAFQLEPKLFEKEFKKAGDIGRAVELFKSQHRSLEDLRLTREKDLSVLDVYKSLHDLATRSGPGSQEQKINILSHLIRTLDPISCRYLVRIPLGSLRMGFSDMTVLDAFSWALIGDKSLRPRIQGAYHVRPDLGFIGKILKEKKEKGLDDIKPAVFTPIIMMRAERLSSGQEIIKKIGKAGVEPKYDGFRLQIHYKKSEGGGGTLRLRSGQEGEVRLYSRNLEDVSFMYPDLVQAVKKEVKAKNIIFEGEAIGYDPKTGSFLPFQETVQRKRKYGIEEKLKEIPLKLFAFELLFLNDNNFIDKPFSERRKKLLEVVKTTDSKKADVVAAEETLISDPKKLELMFDDAVSRGLEGIVAKKLDGLYQPGARGWNWIKFKRSYSVHVEDTIDCLVMGYDLGRGRRVGFGIGAFLAGVYDEKKDMFVTIAKIGTGLTDAEWRALQAECQKYKKAKKPAIFEVDRMMDVDVWVDPAIVVEIRADEITRSPVHTAGRILKPSRSGSAFDVETAGYALRFPRLERFRADKRPEDATSLSELEKLYKSQKKA